MGMCLCQQQFMLQPNEDELEITPQWSWAQREIGTDDDDDDVWAWERACKLHRERLKIHTSSRPVAIKAVKKK